MNELGAAERSLLAALAEADEPSEADRERVRALVLHRVATATGLAAATWLAGSAATGGVAASGAAASSAAAGSAVAGSAAVGTAALGSSATASAAMGASTVVASAAAVTWKGAVAAKVAAAVLGVGVASGAGWYAVSAPSDSAPASNATTIQAPAQPAAASMKALSPAAPAAVQEPAAVPAVEPVTAVRRNIPSEVKADDRLSDEAELLKRAQQAINSGNNGAALSLLQQHATKFPGGVLVQERIGLRAITLCRAGQRDQGVAEATRFLKANPSSPLSERVKSSCELTASR